MMKYLSILGIIILMTGNYCYSQSVVEDIAIELCNNLEEINLDKPNDVIVQESIQIITATYQSLQNQIMDLLPEYSKTYKNMSDIELSKIVGRDMTYFLMRNCEIYQRMTMFNNQPVPEISPEIEAVGKHFTKLLIQKTTDTIISQAIIDDCMREIFMKQMKELGNKFDADYAIKFENEFKAYIMTKCEPYMRWLVSQVDY